jgi:hypothetical protein
MDAYTVPHCVLVLGGYQPCLSDGGQYRLPGTKWRLRGCVHKGGASHQLSLQCRLHGLHMMHAWCAAGLLIGVVSCAGLVQTPCRKGFGSCAVRRLAGNSAPKCFSEHLDSRIFCIDAGPHGIATGQVVSCEIARVLSGKIWCSSCCVLGSSYMHKQSMPCTACMQVLELVCADGDGMVMHVW